ncbi:Ig-like domain-containing protein [Serratia fonticola]
MTISLMYTNNGTPVSGVVVNWSTSAGSLSTESGRTGTAGGAKVKLTSDAPVQAVVTAQVEGITVNSELITFA